MAKRPRLSRVVTTAAALALAASLAGCGAPVPDRAEPTRTSSSSAPGTQPMAPIDDYVALGDSYSAAPLVAPQRPGDVCMRSAVNYPTLIGQEVGASVDDRTCSQAQFEQLTTAQAPSVPPQLDGLTDHTDLVTIGLGANPAASRAWFLDCPRLTASDPHGSPCRDYFERSGTDQVMQVLDQGRQQMVDALHTIHRRSPNARVLVIGYPDIFPATGTCDELGLATGDVAYARRVLQHLNHNLERAAAQGDATYVDTYTATRGHDICASDPWIQGRTSAPGVAMFYHPRAAEQQAVADLVVSLLR
ncbi:SGNH/GDSL hydrolase family protein [Nocardioides jiangxiensis]|uniref:SGNH/GDSL hydrolase family protein n=1 Tax=Nocardioides jiangxiensis TaxID=3064524 RepID=A0ABT9B3Z2_9ACTN|nr:SGNH/GDSL hydrolase family protein [Nocardioides sp. WY-20]MDO7869100.1 SGNH/GDSL hydrolase family protein [Nocardioides sp. WY-20]